MAQPALEAVGIYKNYEGKPLLKGVSFQVDQGETLALLGPSGGGKSTLLRMIAGLEEIDQGQVRWEGQDLAAIPAHKRGFGLMFQDYALFPHRSVMENVAFGLRMQRLPAREIHQRAVEALEMVNLAGFARRRVTDLSGGEQQRVALARALAPRPRLLMLDEPLGALDRSLRAQLLQELRRILHAAQIPALYVTHDQEEAFSLADRLLLLHQGQIVQAGAPQAVYNRPASAWVARFFGLDNLLDGTLIAPDSEPGKPAARLPWVRTGLGVFTPREVPAAAALGAPVKLLLRPAGAVVLTDGDKADSHNQVTGQVVDAAFQGEQFRVSLACAGGGVLSCYLRQPVQRGDTLRVAFSPDEIICLPAEP